MRILPECYGCLERLVELTVSLATESPKLRARARDAALAVIAEESGPGAIPALIANRFHLAIQEITGNPDPFALRKLQETEVLRRLFDKVAPNHGGSLESLLKLAVAGNAVDFFREEAEVAQEIMAGVQFHLSQQESLESALAQAPGLLLYLADNAGEQFFDLPLAAHLRGRGWEVVYVVKGGAIQNDLTREDLYASGVGPALEPVADTGARTVGLDLGGIGAEFSRLWRQADLVLAKGMGHFETMCGLDDPRIFFLLQAKCGAVAQAFGVPRWSFIFQRLSG